MSLIIKIPGVTFTDSALPTLKRDSMINSGTVFLYDTLNAGSYPKQGAPSAGSPSADRLVNLVDNVADGLITSPGGQVTWGANGGLVSDAASFDNVILKNNVALATPTKAVAIVWLKHGSSASTNDIIFSFGGIAGLTHNNTTKRFLPFTNMAGQTCLPTLDTSTVVGSVMQIAISVDNADLTYRFYVNGVQLATGACYQIIQTPGIAELMAYSGFGPSYVGTFYRALLDNLTSGQTAQQVISADYAANVGRFS